MRLAMVLLQAVAIQRAPCITAFRTATKSVLDAIGGGVAGDS